MSDADEGASRSARSRPRSVQTVGRYVWYNRLKALRDVLAALVMVVAVSYVFEQTGLPEWSYYLLLFLVLIVYVQFVEPWERPPMEGEEDDSTDR